MPYTKIDRSRLLKVFDISIPRDMMSNEDYLFGQLGSLPQTIQNGGFEVDSVGLGQPDNITITTFPGGSVSIDASVSGEGSQCLKFVDPGQPGAGGGTAEMDYVPCSELRSEYLGWIHWCNAPTMHNLVQVRFFDRNKIYLSTSPVYDSKANPTSATYFAASFLPPAGARYYKIDLIGGHTDTSVAGTAWFDAVALAGADMFRGRPVTFSIPARSSGSGVFADVASTVVTIPYVSIPVLFTFNASIMSDGTGASAHMRFRIGSSYSNQVDSASGIYEPHSIALPGVVDASGNVTIYMQLLASGTNASGKVDAGSGYKVRADYSNL
jgi:hypothetical protein